jgi:hypothetical protein
MEQADMWDLDGKDPSHIANYEPFIASIASNTTAFGKPVLLLNGDSHIYRSDNPLSATAPCIIESPAGEVACTTNLGLHPQFVGVDNFHRLVVHGSTSPRVVKLSIVTTTANIGTSTRTLAGPMNTGLSALPELDLVRASILAVRRFADLRSDIAVTTTNARSSCTSTGIRRRASPDFVVSPARPCAGHPTLSGRRALQQ